MVKPWLWLPAKLAHDLSPVVIRALGHLRPYKAYNWEPFSWQGLEFGNRLGIAGGVDKDAHSVKGWWCLGAGFVEVGTVTPKPQGPNPGKIIARDRKHQALWNRMGFPSKGSAYVKKQLEKIGRPYFTPIFVNVGKNRSTSLEEAYKDYISCMEIMRPWADAFVINVSSPNTVGLRQLLEPTHLANFLKPVVDAAKDSKLARPLLLKLSPDMDSEQVKSALDVSLESGVDGWILCNTTLEREEGLYFPDEGGVSGAPLSSRSQELLQLALKHLGARRQGKLVVSVGGVMTPEDVQNRLKMGADLVQVYSALVFSGLSFFRQTAKVYT